MAYSPAQGGYDLRLARVVAVPTRSSCACAIISDKPNVIHDLAIEGVRQRVRIERYHRRSLRFRRALGIGT